MKTKVKRKPKKRKVSQATTTISNSTFNGVVFDAKAVDAISAIASGLTENAKGLQYLAQVLTASHVKIECLLKIDGR